MADDVIGLDQTGWKRLNAEGATPWQVWCLTTEVVVYHRICEDKSAASWNAIVGDDQGVVVCDAMTTHGAAKCHKPGPTLAACWAHVVRKFRDAEPDFPEATVARDLIKKLYDIDAKAKSRDERARLRSSESSEVLGELEQWLLAQTTLKRTSLGQAIRYTVGYWLRLKVFVDNPDVPLVNNRTERGIRGPVVGRKNHYGSRSKRGTEVAALFYSLIETVKLVGVEPRRYLQGLPPPRSAVASCSPTSHRRLIGGRPTEAIATRTCGHEHALAAARLTRARATRAGREHHDGPRRVITQEPRATGRSRLRL